MRRSKIVATLGPATEKEETILNLIASGVNFFRFNRKYSPVEWHINAIKTIRKQSLKLSKRVGIIIDIPRADFAQDIEDYDYMALSYLKSHREVVDLKNRLARNKKCDRVIAKIENGYAMKDLENIVKAADAVMVARGDLGKEVPIKELAYLQKKIIDSCRQNHKPVIVATQMLLSMVDNKQPTRAEATDVANAVFDGTDALMLSEETSIGHNPVEAVKTMAEIAEYCEETNELRKIKIEVDNLSKTLLHAAAQIIDSPNNWPIKAIVVFTKSGYTSRFLSSYRLRVPIIAISDDQKVLAQMALSYGVIPYHKNYNAGKFLGEGQIFGELVTHGILKKSDEVLLIHGNNWLESGSINNITIVKV
jgi:pyruvate kinase